MDIEGKKKKREKTKTVIEQFKITNTLTRECHCSVRTN